MAPLSNLIASVNLTRNFSGILYLKPAKIEEKNEFHRKEYYGHIQSQNSDQVTIQLTEFNLIDPDNSNKIIKNDDYMVTAGNTVFCPDCFISPETSMIFEDIVCFLTDKMSPAISISNLFLNIICIIVLSNKIFKGSLYKFFLYNSIFDSILLLLVTIKPIVKIHLLEKPFELYIYIYVSSVSLTCSNLCKIAISIDRYSKMTGKWRPFLKKSDTLIIVLMICFSLGFNGPMLFGYNILEYLWFKQTYYELVMNRIGHESFKGNIMILNAIILDTGIYLTILIINVKLTKAIKKNIENLELLNKIENRSETVIKISDEKDQKYDYDEDDVTNDEDRLSFRGKSLDENDKTFTEKKKDFNQIEAARQKLCSLVLINNTIFFIGHGLFSLSALLQHLMNFYYGPLDVKIGYNYFAYLDLLNSMANLVLFWSMGMNFFAYLFYNQRFKIIFRSIRKCCFNITKTTNKPDVLKR